MATQIQAALGGVFDELKCTMKCDEPSAPAVYAFTEDSKTLVESMMADGKAFQVDSGGAITVVDA